MLRWFRTRSRGLALGVLWSMSVLAALTAAPHAIDCSDDPETVAITHYAGGHAIAAVRTTDEPLHCVLCHWIRAFSADGVRISRVAISHQFTLSGTPVFVEATRTAARLNLASRAPPA